MVKTLFHGVLFWCCLLVLSSYTGQTVEASNDEDAGALHREMSELESLQKKIEDEKIQFQKARDREKKVISELNRIEKDLANKKKSLRRYDVQLKKKQGEIRKLSGNIETLQRTIAEQEAQLGDYGQVLYKLSRTDLFIATFSTLSFPEFMRLHEYLTRIIDYNVSVINQYTKNIERIEQDRKLLQKNENKLATLATETRSTQKRILQHKQEKRTLLVEVTSKKELHLVAIEELEEASRQLQALIEKLGKSTSASTVSIPKQFSACKSKCIFPVNGDIISFFGQHEDKEFSTISWNNGIEIRSAIGKPIQAVFDGYVIYADWFNGYGNLLIIDHGEGYYTLSGHASELVKNVGDQVKEGETIGYVGDTGSLRGPNLYFEIRHHGKPVDPLEWLESRK